MSRFTSFVLVSALLSGSGVAQAMPIGGFAATDRLGYSGSITRHNSYDDALNGINSTDTVTVGNRDLSLFIADNDTSISNWNVMMGSWWYTTDSQGRLGWGNTRGNTGVGYVQLYDNDGSTDSNVSMAFDSFDGSYYTDFNLNLTGSNAGVSDFARLSAYDNVNDGGIWHEYALNLTATGLEGTTTAPGIIESFNQPTGVSGSIAGVFEITENQTSPANLGFYAVDFDLSMDNWAWDNRNELMTLEDESPVVDEFAQSTFRTVQEVPEPGTLGLLGFGLLSLGVLRRRRA